MKGALLTIFLASLSLVYGFGVHPTRCETFGLSRYTKIQPSGEELVGISQQYLFSHAQGFTFIGQIDLFDGNNSIVEIGFAPEFCKSFKEFPTSNSHGRLDRDSFISSRLEDVVGSASYVYNTNVDISNGVNFLSGYIISENPVNPRPDLAWFEGQDWQAEYHGHLEQFQGKYMAVECEKGWEYCSNDDIVHVNTRKSLGSFGSGNPLLLSTPSNHTCGFVFTFEEDGLSTAFTFQTSLALGDYLAVYEGNSTDSRLIIEYSGNDYQGVQPVLISDAQEIFVVFYSDSEEGHGFHAIYERTTGEQGTCFTAVEGGMCDDSCLVSFVTGGFVEGFIDTSFNWGSCANKWTEQCAIAAEFAIDIQFCTVPRMHARDETPVIQRSYDFYVSQ